MNTRERIEAIIDKVVAKLIAKQEAIDQLYEMTYDRFASGRGSKSKAKLDAARINAQRGGRKKALEVEITREMAERFIAKYCVDTPLPDAVERLMAVKRLQKYRGRHWVQIISSEDGVKANGQGLLQEELDKILYGETT